jgi:two-component system, response regulator PdtaR
MPSVGRELELTDIRYCRMIDSPTNAPSVLVVEDEPLIRMLVVDVLAERGLEVREASTAEEALAILAGQPEVKVLFTDLNMPGALDGLELARRVHQHWPDVELLLTSGRERIPKEEIPDAGTFIPKPYDIEAVADRIFHLAAA